ncbi:phosphoribosylanthranilate isomerase [Algoriphagus mannitolivorans]|uniref:phosphoribosylanthranilate isomerase n=1 Tax=Algoriphagus mannitolivorans TaxID=226504 RepID=UPI00040F0A3D|nr:phosphoribosylanthranilate isomerase [Algoriphagus mannitolivorans]
MALQTFVKINHVTNLTDARYCSGMMVNLLGFSLDPKSPNYVSPEEYKEITGWVSGVDFVAEFSWDSSLDILESLKNYPEITWIEYDRLEDLKKLQNQGYSLIYKVNLNEIKHLEEQLSEHLSDSEILIHIQTENEKLSESDKQSILSLTGKCKILLGSGINVDNVLTTVNDLNIYGITLNGGKEIKAGLRDFDQMADILEKLEIED